MNDTIMNNGKSIVKQWHNNKDKMNHDHYDMMITYIQKLRQICGDIVNDYRVSNMITIMIVINSIMMGIGTYSFIEDNSLLEHIWNTTDKVFLIIFTIELGLQFIYHGYQLFLDGWLLFDTVIISLSWILNGFEIIRALRIFRTLRIISRLKPLRTLITSLFDVLPSIRAVIMLLLLIMYIYAVLCTTLFGTLYIDGVTSIDYFSRLDISMFTLFQMITLEWSDIVREVCIVYPYAWVIFITFVIFTAFILYSLIVAVVCDAVAVAERNAHYAAEDNDENNKINNDKNQDKMSPEQQQNLRMKLIQERIYDITYQQSLLIKYMEQQKGLFHKRGDCINLQQSSNNNSIPRRNVPTTMNSNYHQRRDESIHFNKESNKENEHHSSYRCTLDPDLDEYMSVNDNYHDDDDDDDNSSRVSSDRLTVLLKNRFERDDIDAYMTSRDDMSSSSIYSVTKITSDNNSNQNNRKNKKPLRSSLQMMNHVLRKSSNSILKKNDVFVDVVENDFYQKQQNRLLLYRQKLRHK